MLGLKVKVNPRTSPWLFMAAMVGVLAAWATFWGSVIYVAVHFIQKYW